MSSVAQFWEDSFDSHLESYCRDLSSGIDQHFFITREDAENLNYPTVRLRIRLDQTGKLTGWEVAKSSGLQTADDLAMNALQLAEKSIPRLPQGAPSYLSFEVSFTGNGPAVKATFDYPDLIIFMRALERRIKPSIQDLMDKRANANSSNHKDFLIGMIFREKRDWYEILPLDSREETPEVQQSLKLLKAACLSLSDQRPRFPFEVRSILSVDGLHCGLKFFNTMFLHAEFVHSPNIGEWRRNQWTGESRLKYVAQADIALSSNSVTAQELLNTAWRVQVYDKPRYRALLEKSFELDPTNVDVLFKLAMSFYTNAGVSGTDSLEKVLQYLNKAIELDPKNKVYIETQREVQSVIMIRAGRYQDAVEFAQIHDISASIHFRWAMELEGLGDFENASSEWRQALLTCNEDEDPDQVKAVSERISECEKKARFQPH